MLPTTPSFRPVVITWIVAIGVATAIAACAGRTGALGAVPDHAGANRPNIVLIYVDDLGWRDLAIQGSEYYDTPNVDRLASQGMRFTDAYSNAPNCAPSRAALMSGQYGPRTGIYTVGSAARGREADRQLIPVENNETLALDVVTVAEALQRAGYATGHIGKWHLGGEGFLPTDQGFAWSIGGNALGAPPSHVHPYARAGRSLPGLEKGMPGEYLADRLTEEAIGFLERERGGPFFLYLSHYGVHTPIQGPPALVARYREKPTAGGQDNPEYGAMISAVDDGVGRLMAALDRLALADNTVLIFYSDNGGFGPVTSMVPLRGSKGSLYEGGIRVPLIVRWPGHITAGSVSGAAVIGTDFYPTLLELAGSSATEGLDGRSLVPLWTGAHTTIVRDLFWHFPAYLEADRSVTGPWRTTPVSAMRRGDYKIVHTFEGDRWELYNLRDDIGETRDLAAAMPAQLLSMRGSLEQWWHDTGAFLPKAK